MTTLAEQLIGSRVEDYPRDWAWCIDQLSGLARPSQLRWLWEEEGT